MEIKNYFVQKELLTFLFIWYQKPANIHLSQQSNLIITLQALFHAKYGLGYGINIESILYKLYSIIQFTQYCTLTQARVSRYNKSHFYFEDDIFILEENYKQRSQWSISYLQLFVTASSGIVFTGYMTHICSIRVILYE